MIEIHAKSVTNGLIIMLGKVEMCRFLRCNGSIVRHYTSGIINVEEPVKSLKRWVSCRLDEDDPSPPKNLPNLTAFVVGNRSQTLTELLFIHSQNC